MIVNKSFSSEYIDDVYANEEDAELRAFEIAEMFDEVGNVDNVVKVEPFEIKDSYENKNEH